MRPACQYSDVAACPRHRTSHSPASTEDVEDMLPPQDRTRRLIWIRILHSPSDLGSVGKKLQQLYVQRTSHEDWDQHIRTVDDAWRRIRQVIEQLHLDYPAVRVYQDGLPQCAYEMKIIQELAASGSQNHQILLDLAQRGATIVGTECPELLLEEYALVNQSLSRLLSADADQPSPEHEEQKKSVLERRDRFIAQRVDETLKPGEVGLIFLGLLHSLEQFLPPDIKTRHEAWWTTTNA
jgi:hypothetical protein